MRSRRSPRTVAGLGALALLAGLLAGPAGAASSGAVSGAAAGGTAASGAAASGAAASGVVEARARTAPRYREYVSLGDSWAANVKLLDRNGLPDTRHAPIDCAQSQTNYPKLVAKALGVRVHRDATCGSAQVSDFARPQTDLPLGGTNPPQFDRLTRTTDLVTVGVGGNDAGFSSAALTCLSLLPVEVPLADLLPLPGIDDVPLGGCRDRYAPRGGTDQLAQAINRAESRVVWGLRSIRARSPKARILMVNYLDAVPERGCYPRLPATDDDVRYLHLTFKRLNAMLRRAARTARVEYVDTWTATRGHDLCTGPTTRYAELLGPSVNDVAIMVPAHPNSAGARAQAVEVLRVIRSR